jgi:hypothetical protein
VEVVSQVLFAGVEPLENFLSISIESGVFHIEDHGYDEVAEALVRNGFVFIEDFEFGFEVFFKFGEIGEVVCRVTDGFLVVADVEVDRFIGGRLPGRRKEQSRDGEGQPTKGDQSFHLFKIFNHHGSFRETAVISMWLSWQLV